jgi:hypothetical protein
LPGEVAVIILHVVGHVGLVDWVGNRKTSVTKGRLTSRNVETPSCQNCSVLKVMPLTAGHSATSRSFAFFAP